MSTVTGCDMLSRSRISWVPSVERLSATTTRSTPWLNRWRTTVSMMSASSRTIATAHTPPEPCSRSGRGSRLRRTAALWRNHPGSRLSRLGTPGTLSHRSRRYDARSSMPLPNLFVIGAPKSGTTSLHRYLDQHPSIAMSVVKEPKFFLADGTRPRHGGPGDERACRSYVVDRSEYEALFRYPEGPVSYAGESSPFYLWHPDAPARIHALVPEARLVAVLREPTMRAYSNWADLREQDREKLDFPAALAAEERRRLDDWEPFWFYRSLG